MIGLYTFSALSYKQSAGIALDATRSPLRLPLPSVSFSLTVKPPGDILSLKDEHNPTKVRRIHENFTLDFDFDVRDIFFLAGAGRTQGDDYS